MAKTLLALTQSILSAMDSDEVNSIYDTVEAHQVAMIVLETLEAEFNNIELPTFNKILQLTSVSDINRPNYLRYGDDVHGITWLRYRDERNKNTYREVEWLTPTEFFKNQLLLTGTGTNTVEINDLSGVSYFIKTNKSPTYYTSLDNNLLIFDSYDKLYDDTLQQSKVFALGSNSLADGEMTNEYVPPIPNNLFPLLLAEARATCFITLKQMASPKSEQVARRQRSRMQASLYKSAKANYPYARSKYDYARNR